MADLPRSLPQERKNHLPAADQQTREEVSRLAGLKHRAHLEGAGSQVGTASQPSWPFKSETSAGGQDSGNGQWWS